MKNISFNFFSNDLLSGFISRSFIVLVNQLSMLIALTYILYKLDLNSFGYLSIAMIIIQVSCAISDWGFNYYSINYFNKEKKKKIDIFVSDIFFCKVFLIVVQVVILIILIFFFDVLESQNHNFFSVLIFSIIGAGLSPLWYFQAKDSVSKLHLPTFISRVLYLGLVFFGLNFGFGIDWIIFAQGTSFFLISFFGIYQAIRDGNYFFPSSIFRIIFHLKKATPFFVTNAVNSYFHSIWGLVLIFFAVPGQVALFNICDIVYRSLMHFVNILPEVVITKLKKNSNSNRYRSLIVISIIVFIGYCIIVNNIDFIISFLPKNYYGISEILPYSLTSFLLIAISRIWAYPFIGIIFGDRYVGKIYVLFAFVIIIMMLIFITINIYSAYLMSVFILVNSLFFIFMFLYKPLINFFYFKKIIS